MYNSSNHLLSKNVNIKHNDREKSKMNCDYKKHDDFFSCQCQEICECDKLRIECEDINSIYQCYVKIIIDEKKIICCKDNLNKRKLLISGFKLIKFQYSSSSCNGIVKTAKFSLPFFKCLDIPCKNLDMCSINTEIQYVKAKIICSDTVVINSMISICPEYKPISNENCHINDDCWFKAEVDNICKSNLCNNDSFTFYNDCFPE